jgi:exopolysaccharide production protein ExoZ
LKLNSVQYLRGLAALLVVVTHALAHPYDMRAELTQRMAGAGVTLFFVISGFIMVRVSGAGRFDPIDFYRRRVERVVPLYWLATLALALVAVIAPGLLKATQFDWKSLIQSLLFIPHYRANGELVPLLKLGWTLNLEMFFYLLFGLFAWLGAVNRVLLLSTILAGLALLGQLVRFENALLAAYTAPHLLSFCFGMWTALWLAKVEGSDRTMLGRRMAAAGAALLLLSLVVPGGFPALPILLMQASASVLLIAGGVLAERALPELPAAGLMGDASYSIYLIHMYPLALLIVLWQRFAPELPPAIVVPLCLSVGTAGGVAVYLLVERPVVRWFAARRGRPAARPIQGAGIAGELR